MNIEAYLKRIRYAGPLRVDAETLRGLHRAHMIHVPFENLDIHLGRTIVLDEKSFYNKIIVRRRGGFCYELNGLFGNLLRELGFDVQTLSARVRENGFGPEFDHMALLVTLEERWLADVGFGDSFREPLRLDHPGNQVQDGVAYGVIASGDDWTLTQQLPGKEREPQYRFTLTPHPLSDFAGMCHYHQTSPLSHFTQKRVCSLATPDGRVTLSDMKLIVTANGQRNETVLATQEEYAQALERYFGMIL